MTTEKHGIFIATLDVASLERRFPLPLDRNFPDGSDGSLGLPCPPCGKPAGQFPNAPESIVYQFSDGADAIAGPERGKKEKLKENIIVQNGDLFVSPGRSQKYPSVPSEPSSGGLQLQPAQVEIGLRQRLDGHAALGRQRDAGHVGQFHRLRLGEVLR